MRELPRLSHLRRNRARLPLAAALGLAVVLILPAAGRAQDGPSIAVVDAGRVFQESQYGTNLLEELKQLREQKRAEGQVKQGDAKALQDRITQSRLALSPEKLEELQKELEQKVIALQRFEDDAKREIDEASTTAMTEFNAQIMPVIDQVAREKGFALIFNKYEAGLLFAHEQVDITDTVIARFDETNPPASAPTTDAGESGE